MTAPKFDPSKPCPKCGAMHEPTVTIVSGGIVTRCQKHNRAGRQCGGTACVGLDACFLHAGISRAKAKAKAHEVRAHAAALGEAGSLIAQALGVVEEQSNPEQLQAAINRAGAMALAYEWLVSELPARSTWHHETALTSAGSVQRLVVIDDEGMVGPDQHGNQKLHAYEEGLRHWTKLHGDLLRTAAAIGLEDRRQRFAEAQVRAVTGAIRHLVTGLGAELDDPKVVPVVEQALLMIASDAPQAIEATAR